MAGLYCHVTGVTFASGRLQVAYEQRNGDLVTVSVVDTGQIGYDVSTVAQKLASLQSQLNSDLGGLNTRSTAAKNALATVQSALVGVNIPAAP